MRFKLKIDEPVLKYDYLKFFTLDLPVGAV